jgi:hypothetical protein
MPGIASDSPSLLSASSQKFVNNATELVELLQPETYQESLLLSIPVFQQGLLWGQPRFGHPEGQICLHIREVLNNINKINCLTEADRNKLRIIALAHDTFKFAEDKNKPRDWSKHHGRLARQFMENHTQDNTILDIIEIHDDAFYAWLSSRQQEPPREKKWQTLEQIQKKMGSNLQLYYLFFKCDTLTGDKTRAPLLWFEKQLSQIEIVEFDS